MTTSLRIPKIVALALVIFLALFLRLYKLNETSYFNYDEARDAIAERSILRGKLTLLGPETTLGNVTTHFGPAHYYLMAPALFLSRLDPIGPYIFTAVLGVLTTLVIWIWTRNYLTAFFYAVFPIAVFFSRISWNPNTVPFFIASGFYLIKQKRHLLSGIFFGIAIQLHWTAGLLVLIAIASLFVKNKSLKAGLLFSGGVLLGLLPIIIFDIRHDFLYLHSLVSLVSKGQAAHGFPAHYFLGFLPLLALGIKFLPRQLAKIVISISFAASLYMVFSLKANHQYTINFVRSVSETIYKDQKDNGLPFNVAAEISSDARAYSYRYFLTHLGLTPLGPAEYSVSDHVYVITDKDIPAVINSPLYEISSFHPKTISKIWTISGYYIYRLEK